MSPHPDTLFWFRANQILLFRYNAACLAENHQIPVLKSGLTQSRLIPTIYRAQGENATHYTTDVAIFHMKPPRCHDDHLEFSGLRILSSVGSNQSLRNRYLHQYNVCVSGTTYVSTDCYFSELALQNSTKLVGPSTQQTSHPK